MSTSDTPKNPADRSTGTRTDKKDGMIKGRQLEGSRRTDTDLPHGLGPAFRGSSNRR
jgi:hypothetical protein